MRKIIGWALIIFLILGCIGGAISLVTKLAGGPSSDEPLYLNEEFTVSSKVQNVLLQTYRSTIKAEIVNNTDQPMTNVVFTIGVKTNTLGNAGTATITVPYIAANSKKTISTVLDSNQNYETVTSVSYTADGIASTTIANEVPSADSGAVAGVICGFVAIIVIVIVIVVIIKKKRRNRERAEASAKYEDALYNSSSIVSIPQTNTELEMQKLALEKEHQKTKQELAKLEMAKLEAEKEALITCPYCGKRIQKNISECPYCGASADK